jgi:hypothetical protein
MSWNRGKTEDLAKSLRFVGWAFVALDAILLAMFSFWFAWRFLGSFKDWLVKTIFSAPW